eukprot:1817435-Pyramimonas_sp.AAC.1
MTPSRAARRARCTCTSRSRRAPSPRSACSTTAPSPATSPFWLSGPGVFRESEGFRVRNPPISILLDELQDVSHLLFPIPPCSPHAMGETKTYQGDATFVATVNKVVIDGRVLGLCYTKVMAAYVPED